MSVTWTRESQPAYYDNASFVFCVHFENIDAHNAHNGLSTVNHHSVTSIMSTVNHHSVTSFIMCLEA
jgi:hypothetical protein